MKPAPREGLARAGGAGCVAAIACVVLAFGCSRGPAQVPSDAPAAGPPAPPFTLPMLDGSNVSLSDLRGAPVLLNIWATWCAPCREELPSLVRLSETFGDTSLAVLAVSVDEDRDVVVDFVRQHRVPLVVLWDPAREVYARYGVTTIPCTFLLDREGRVVERIEGAIDWTDALIQSRIRDLLARAEEVAVDSGAEPGRSP